MANTIQVQKLTTLTGHRDCIYTVGPSDEESHFISAGGDGMIVKWPLSGLENGKLIARVENSVYAFHVFKPTNRLLVGHNYEGVHEIDINEKKEVRSSKLTTAAIFDISSYKNYVLVGDGNGILTVIDYSSWEIIYRLTISSKSLRTLAVNPVRKELAIGSSDNMIRIIDLESFQLKQQVDAHKNSVFTLRYNPDYSKLLSGSRDAHLKIWDSEQNYQLIEPIVAHMYAINSVDFSANGKHFVTCSMDKSIKVWDAFNHKLLKVIDKSRHAGHGTSVNKIFWSSHEDIIVSGSDDRTISLWKLDLDR